MKKFKIILTLATVLSMGAVISGCSSAQVSEETSAMEGGSASDQAALDGLAASESAVAESTPPPAEESSFSAVANEPSPLLAEAPAQSSPVDLGASSAGRAN